MDFQGAPYTSLSTISRSPIIPVVPISLFESTTRGSSCRLFGAKSRIVIIEYSRLDRVPKPMVSRHGLGSLNHRALRVVAPRHNAARSALPRERFRSRVTSRRDDYIDLMSGVPQKAADLLQRASRQVWAITGHPAGGRQRNLRYRFCAAEPAREVFRFRTRRALRSESSTEKFFTARLTVSRQCRTTADGSPRCDASIRGAVSGVGLLRRRYARPSICTLCIEAGTMQMPRPRGVIGSRLG